MKRKLKTIKKLLDENPSARFDKAGNLDISNSYIGSRSLWEFGKEISATAFYPENFFEPEPEKKKIYFYNHTERPHSRVEYYDVRQDITQCENIEYLGSITLDVE